MAVSCQQFNQLVAAQTEHLDEIMLKDVTPFDTLLGSVETGTFKAEDGVSHTFDKINDVWPDMSTSWSDVSNTACVGTPCDPTYTQIGMGSTRSSYSLKEKYYDTDIFCYDQIMTRDKAKQVFAGFVSNLESSTNIIGSNRILNEYLRNCGYIWTCTTSGLTATTITENSGDLINITLKNSSNATITPNSDLFANHLRQRVDAQILTGALGKMVKGMPNLIEVMSDRETIWNLVQGNAATIGGWRFTDFDTASKEFYEYGWTARVGNFALKAQVFPMRFQINASNQLVRVFPYTNVAATLGIKRQVNEAFLNAPVQIDFIWHRRGMRVLVLDNTTINPRMPFLSRSFSGKWMWVQDNLSCGTTTSADGKTVPIFVPNPLRNKGKFIGQWKWATQAQFPEYMEAFIHLRAQPCVVGASPCGLSTSYPTQSYSSANDLCA